MEIEPMVDYDGIGHRLVRKKRTFTIAKFYSSKLDKNIQISRFYKKAFPDVPHTSWVLLSKFYDKNCNISKIWRYVFDYLAVIQIWSFNLKWMILQIRFKFELRPNNQKRCARFYLYHNFSSKVYLETLRECGEYREMPF